MNWVLTIASCLLASCADIRSAKETKNPPTPVPPMTLESRDYSIGYPFDEVPGLTFKASLNTLTRGEEQYLLTLDWVDRNFQSHHGWLIYFRYGKKSIWQAAVTFKYSDNTLPMVIPLIPPLPDSVDIRFSYSLNGKSCDDDVENCPLIKRIEIRQ